METKNEAKIKQTTNKIKSNKTNKTNKQTKQKQINTGCDKIDISKQIILFHFIYFTYRP